MTRFDRIGHHLWAIAVDADAKKQTSTASPENSEPHHPPFENRLAMMSVGKDCAINTSVFEFVVAYADTDAGGVVYHSRYLEHSERARGKHLLDLGISQRALTEENHLVFVVTKNETNYLSPACFEDRLVIESSITEVGAVRIEFYQQIFKGAKRLVTNIATLACIDANTMRPQKIPPELREKLCSPIANT